jgi:hypothetical protein
MQPMLSPASPRVVRAPSVILATARKAVAPVLMRAVAIDLAGEELSIEIARCRISGSGAGRRKIGQGPENRLASQEPCQPANRSGGTRSRTL